MIFPILSGLGLAVALAALDLIVESARSGATELTFLGLRLWELPSGRIGIYILTGLGTLAGVVLTVIWAAWRDRRLDRWFEGERSAKYAADAGVEARTRLLEQRAEFLQGKVDELTEARERLSRENEELGKQAEELENRIVVMTKRLVDHQERVIVLPDVEGSQAPTGNGPKPAAVEGKPR